MKFGTLLAFLQLGTTHKHLREGGKAMNLIPWRKDRNDRSLSTRTAHPFDLLRQEFDTLFDRFFGSWPELGSDWDRGANWGLDLDDTGKEVVMRAEAPGFEASDFDVQVSGDVLTIRAERKEEGNGKGKDKDKEKRSERRWARMERSVTLPQGTDANKVEARYRNGVLDVHLAKSLQAQPKRIEVKS
jgi:HSP20 family protein